MVHLGTHVYSCKECDFLGHIECILRKEPPSPFCLKDLYSCGKDVARATFPEECVTNEMEKKLVVDDIGHIHVLRLIQSQYYECLGFPANVKSQLHQHTLEEGYSSQVEKCMHCRSETKVRYSCKQCKDIFHKECIMSKDDRKAATEEEQLADIYFMYIERFLFKMFKEEDKE
ncbi:hypothetical protein AALP_AA2G037200 [Arabis alpina]|uniref:DC1 domain-containing protein n=1 Tax=Arabis alpina TaxID=50452 RepID=A0A087HF57_ARAAL|nr:hypothetical protein AALP_AA2G037200 [Arabis alpina]